MKTLLNIRSFKEETCQECSGSGLTAGPTHADVGTCHVCGGTGTVN